MGISPMKPQLLLCKKQQNWYQERGQAMIEMSFAILFFLVMLFALGDFAKIGYNWMVLQYALGEGARLGSLGTDPKDPACSGAQDKRSCSIGNKVKDTAGNLGLDDVTVEFGDTGAGGSLEFFTLIASREVTINNFTGLFLALAGEHGGNYTIKVETVVRNEPF